MTAILIVVSGPKLTSTTCPQVGFSKRIRAVTFTGQASNGPQRKLEQPT